MPTDAGQFAQRRISTRFGNSHELIDAFNRLQSAGALVGFT